MSSTPNTLLRSIRRWVLVAVFLLGITVSMLAYIAYLLAGGDGGALAAAVGVIGCFIAFIAGAAVFTRFSPAE